MSTKMNWPNDFINKIICGDCLEVMKQMPNEYVDMVMTSPPYWGLRDYGIEQIFGGDKDCEHDFGDWKNRKKLIKEHKKYQNTWQRPSRKEVEKISLKKKCPICNNEFDAKPYQEFCSVKCLNTLSNEKRIEATAEQKVCFKCQAWKGQFGLEPTPELYIEHLTDMFNEVKRVLKKEGTLWLNISDTYSGSGGAGGDYNKGGLRDGQPKFKQGETRLQPKCLCMIPERLAWSLVQNGWILRNKIIWYKPNSMPSSVKDRFSNRWEYLFLFVKSSKPIYWTNRKTGQLVTKKPLGIKGLEGIDWEWEEVGVVDKNVFNVRVRDADKEIFMQKATKKEKESYGKSKLKKVSLWTAHDYYFDLDAVREPHKYDGRKDTLYKGGPKDMQIGKHERWPDPAGKNPGDVIKVERKWNEVPGQESQSIARDHAGWFRKDGSSIVDFEKGKNPGDFWNINTQPFPEAHFAVFPEALCEKPIKAGCPEEACKRCGKARERITKLTYSEKRTITEKNSAFNKEAQEVSKKSTPDYRTESKTINWTSCNCNAGFEGGIVLDPFAGAGTVGVVAKKLGRRFILIDIKKEYCEMAEKRIAQVGYQMELRI